MRWVLFFWLIVSCAPLSAQFTYLNQIIGAQGDLSAEGTTNIEVRNDGFVLWGVEIDDGNLFLFVREYNSIGELINNNTLYPDSAEYPLVGITKTFQWNPYTETFVYIHGVNLLGQGITEGYLIEFDTNLDTIFTRRYNHYPPYTYPFIFNIEEDGYVVLGEYGGMLNSVGTFIMKLDFAGNVLWSEIMEPEVYQDIYRNWSIIKLDNGYLIGGWGNTAGSNFEPFGLLTKTDENGEMIEEIFMVDEDMPQSYTVIPTQLSSGEIILSQSFGYEWVSDFGNPNYYWSKTRLSKYDPNTNTTYNEVEYFDNYEFFNGGPNDIVATPDGGVILLGSYLGWYFDATAWMLKLDSNLNQEWYQEYTYETCNDCANLLYDVEIAPDGGYIAAGSFVNYDVDPRSSSWLLKVDTCGDVEWQGCELVGLQEKEPKSFSVYPNPSAGRFSIESDFNHSISSWSVFNLSGQKVAEGKTSQSQVLEINLNLPVGLYALEVVQDDGSRENHKIQILK